MSTDQPALMRCEGLRVGYRGHPLHPPIDLAIRPGEFWAVVGRNGSGKSTWFKTALGLIPPVSGRVAWPAGPVRRAYLAQRMQFDDLYPVTVAQVVALGCERGSSFLRPRLGAPPAVAEALEAVDASALRGRLFRALSEGQKQRVLLARMVASGAQLAFLDEPTAAMDAVAEAEALGLLDDLRARFGVAVVVVSHHLAVARAYANRVLYVDDQNDVAVVGTAAEVFAHAAFRARYGEVTSG